MNDAFSDELISAYLDGELTAEQQSEVEQLLLDSREHRQMFEELRALRNSLQSLPSYNLDDDFAARVVRRADAERDKTSANDPRSGDFHPADGTDQPPATGTRFKRNSSQAAAQGATQGSTQPGSWRAAVAAVAAVAAALFITLFMLPHEKPGEVTLAPVDAESVEAREEAAEATPNWSSFADMEDSAESPAPNDRYAGGRVMAGDEQDDFTVGDVPVSDRRRALQKELAPFKSQDSGAVRPPVGTLSSIAPDADDNSTRTDSDPRQDQNHVENEYFFQQPGRAAASPNRADMFQLESEDVRRQPGASEAASNLSDAVEQKKVDQHESTPAEIQLREQLLENTTVHQIVDQANLDRYVVLLDVARPTVQRQQFDQTLSKYGIQIGRATTTPLFSEASVAGVELSKPAPATPEQPATAEPSATAASARATSGPVVTGQTRGTRAPTTTAPAAEALSAREPAESAAEAQLSRDEAVAGQGLSELAIRSRLLGRSSKLTETLSANGRQPGQSAAGLDVVIVEAAPRQINAALSDLSREGYVVATVHRESWSRRGLADSLAVPANAPVDSTNLQRQESNGRIESVTPPKGETSASQVGGGVRRGFSGVEPARQQSPSATQQETEAESDADRDPNSEFRRRAAKNLRSDLDKSGASNSNNRPLDETVAPPASNRRRERDSRIRSNVGNALPDAPQRSANTNQKDEIGRLSGGSTITTEAGSTGYRVPVPPVGSDANADRKQAIAPSGVSGATEAEQLRTQNEGSSTEAGFAGGGGKAVSPQNRLELAPKRFEKSESSQTTTAEEIIPVPTDDPQAMDRPVRVVVVIRTVTPTGQPARPPVERTSEP